MTPGSASATTPFIRIVAVIAAVWLAALVAGAAEVGPPESPVVAGPKSPKLVIRGLGWIENRKLNRMILQTFPEEKKDQPFDANFIEDAFVVLHNQLLLAGYQEAVIRADLRLTSGEPLPVEWDGKSELNVPRPLAVQEARFKAEAGPLFHFDSFNIEGLTALPHQQANSYFYKTDMLLRLKGNRRYSRQQLNNSVENLRQELVNLGYRDAKVTVAELETEAGTGKVRVTIHVEQGRLYHVADVNVVVMDSTGNAVVSSRKLDVDEPWSPHWQQDFALTLRTEQYRQGRPDARSRIQAARSEERAGVIYESMEALVEPGEEVRLGDVRFEGQRRARLPWLQKKGALEGPLLDRLQVDAARERLSRQGVFDYVGIRYEPDTGPERDVVFELEEGKRIDFSLLAGYGSYDQFFGGAELDQYNLWGVGHTARLRGMLSVKTANVVYTYSVPEFLTPDLGLFGNIDGLLREELTFERQEIKTAIGLRKVFATPGLQAGLRYSYQFLKTEDSPDPNVNDDFTRVSAVILDGQLERRDNPLAPRKGYRLYGTVEVANPALASEAHYELLQVGASGHLPLVNGLILHAAVQHGVIFSPDSANDLPFNKRFLPGGENSVRGYERGGASPYNTQGDQIGAETFLLGNFELEQYLTERWSIVAFVDGVGVAAALANYPSEEILWSVGGGVRWNTIIGPVRAEYGYNLNPRTFDPEGTLHVSIGFPF